MCRVIAALFFTLTVFGQDPALARLKHEMAVAREQGQRDDKNGTARIAAVHAALRDWLEPQLPNDVYALAREFWHLQASLPQELAQTGLSGPDSTDADFDDPAFDQVAIELKMMPELPDMLFVTAGVHVPCGEDEAVYAYRFDSSGRTRVIEDHPKSDWGYGNSKLQLSDPDSQGRRLLLVHGISVQCASFWMEMTYSVYRISSSQSPESLLSSEHGFYLNEDGPAFVLKPEGLTIEFLDRSLDLDIHNRTHIFRYSLANGVRRIEPLAFQPQDFAEDWLTSPWNEVQSVSTPATSEWHHKLHDRSFDQYFNVVPCAAKAGYWAIGLQVTYEGEKELEEPVQNYFLVQDLGDYRYRMEAVSDSQFEGCPGEGSPSDKHPWLSVEQLKALP